jgi:four helix bundle protein
VPSFPSFDEWEDEAADTRRGDPLWRMTAYRLAAYAVEVGWEDARVLHRNPITRSIATQLYRALGSVAANLAEGYSRSSGADRVRIFEYALGSARECREWYLAGKPVLDPTVLATRLRTLDSICRLLLAAIPTERKRQVRRRS